MAKPSFSRSLIFVLSVASVWIANAQTLQTSVTLSGPARLRGAAEVKTKPPTQLAHIYVFTPPTTASLGNNNANFMNSVMPQSSIAGVTVVISWNQVETSDPVDLSGGGTCGAGVNDDQHQLDTSQFCHSYDWSGVDGTPCAAAGGGTLLGQFFCSLNSWGSKKVNPLIFGITTNPNSSTPAYLWRDSTWVSGVGSQPVVNSIQNSGCTGYSGYSSQLTGVTIINSNTTAHVTMTFMPFAVNDTIWTSGFSPSGLNTGTSGRAISKVSTSAPFFFEYPCTGGTCTGTTGVGSAIASQQSYPVPTQLPYKTAFRAFLAAAVYHFAHTNTGMGGVINKDQIAYMRVGIGYGAEAVPSCQAQWPSDTTKDAWLNFYADTNAYLMGITNAAAQGIGGTIFHTQTPINAGGTVISPDLTYADIEAALTVQYTGGDGKRFGFGSQGLQATDNSV